tara:strand:+ start:48 stop:713 length:666 start_codon:yes stop_codon:yes gene_type:complete
MAFKMKGFPAHKGVSSPLNMGPVEEKVKLEKPKEQADIRDTRADRRIKKAVESGNVKKAARISDRMSRRKARKEGKGKTQVAPTSIPVNDPSMKNYHKAVDARTNKKKDTKKEEVKEEPKVSTPKEEVKVKTESKVEPKKTKPVKTLRGTGKTYKSAWEGMSAEKKAKYKGGYSEFKTKAEAWNKQKDIEKGTRLKEGTQGPTKPYKNPNAPGGQKGPVKA